MLPTKPPRDPSGETTPHDHQDIVQSDHLIRGITKRHLVDSEVPGFKRVSSLAANPSSGGVNEGLSCELERLLNTDHILAADRITHNPKWVGLVRLPVKGVRGLNCLVGYDPITTPSNPYHCLIFSNLPFPDHLKVSLVSLFQWVVKPNDVL